MEFRSVDEGSFNEIYRVQKLIVLGACNLNKSVSMLQSTQFFAGSPIFAINYSQKGIENIVLMDIGTIDVTFDLDSFKVYENLALFE